MTHLITKEQYINNPCGVCSTAFWKNTVFQKPNEIQIVHEKELSQINKDIYHVDRYFRLIHDLKDIKTQILPDGFYFQIVNLTTEIETVSTIINHCYENINVTPEQVSEWTKYSVFDNDLWVFVYEESSNSPIALGIADFDKEINEGSLEWIQVIPEKRGFGLGQSLVCELLSRLNGKADFVTVSGLSDDKTNPEALYRKCGFIGDDIWCVIGQ